MHWTHRDRTIALAGIFQAITLVQQLAKTGRVEQIYFEQSLTSLFRNESENTETIFGGLSHLKLGLQTTKYQMGGLTETRNIEFTRFVISVIHLEKQLAKSESMLKKMKLGLEKLKENFQDTAVTDNNVITEIAGLYVKTISTLLPQIQVKGDHAFLSTSGNPEKIRALLLASIRACVLWRQLGGNRWGLLFQRKKYITEADTMLDQIDQSVSI